MTNGNAPRTYDTIVVGTSMICVLEAVYQSLCGKSVLMVDRQAEIGGAWTSLDIFGLHDVENAVHYLLPDPFAPDFMRDVLAWDVIPSERKYRMVPLFGGSCWAVHYDHPLGRFAGILREALFHGRPADGPRRVLEAFRQLFERRPPSYYVRGGAPEMLRKVKAILLASDVEVKYSTTIHRIHIDLGREWVVEVLAGDSTFASKRVVLTSGSRIPSITGVSGAFHINEQRHPRPAVHLLVLDESRPTIDECIFIADPLIKYAHDVTRFVRESQSLVGKKRVVVLALHPHIQRNDDVYQRAFETLQRVRMLGGDAVLADHYWQDVLLPGLDDAELRRLETAFEPVVECLRTENFARGVGHHARRWATKIKPPVVSAAALCSRGIV